MHTSLSVPVGVREKRVTHGQVRTNLSKVVTISPFRISRSVRQEQGKEGRVGCRTWFRPGKRSPGQLEASFVAIEWNCILLPFSEPWNAIWRDGYQNTGLLQRGDLP